MSRWLLLSLALAPGCFGLDPLTDDKGAGMDLDSAPRDTAHQGTDTSHGGSDTGPNRAPVADAGEDLLCQPGDPLQLDGTGSSDPNGDPLFYTWTLYERPRGSVVALDDDALARPSLTPDLPGRYTLRLSVSDGSLVSAPDEVVILAESPNGAPIADAGSDQSVTTGRSVTLSGRASSDPDGDALLYTWSLTTRPAGSSATLSDPSSLSPSFTADVAGVYSAQLVVSDGEFASAPDAVNVSATDPAPVDTGGSGGTSGDICGCHTSPWQSGLQAPLTSALLALGLLWRRRARTTPPA